MIPIDYYGLAAAAMATSFLALLTLSYVRKRTLSVWHALTIGTVAGFAASMAQSYTGLIDWLALGIMGVSTSATLFVVGLAAMCAVMVYNILSTRGATAVR
jgi:hypothetical protein